MLKLLMIDSKGALEIQQMIDWAEYGITSIKISRSFQEAKREILNFHPHIILSDLRIGNKFVYELLDYIDYINVHTEVIIMSESDSFEDARKCFLAGAKDCLLKPISKEQLKDTLGRMDISEYVLEDPILHTKYSDLSPLVNKIIQIVQNEYKKELDLTVLGERLYMNSKYIGRTFLKETSMKFSQYLKCYRMYQAKYLIKTTDQTISSITESVGYHYSNMFYLHFKEIYHFSPTDIRKEGNHLEVLRI